MVSNAKLTRLDDTTEQTLLSHERIENNDFEPGYNRDFLSCYMRNNFAVGPIVGPILGRTNRVVLAILKSYSNSTEKYAEFLENEILPLLFKKKHA